jgi:predicted DNA-binding protein YlxM (UPF0122 family)
MTITKTLIQETERTLLYSSIKRGSKSMEDYERAKRIIKRQAISPGDYEAKIRIAADYIGV